MASGAIALPKPNPGDYLLERLKEAFKKKIDLKLKPKKDDQEQEDIIVDRDLKKLPDRLLMKQQQSLNKCFQESIQDTNVLRTYDQE